MTAKKTPVKKASHPVTVLSVTKSATGIVKIEINFNEIAVLKEFIKKVFSDEEDETPVTAATDFARKPKEEPAPETQPEATQENPATAEPVAETETAPAVTESAAPEETEPAAAETPTETVPPADTAPAAEAAAPVAAETPTETTSETTTEN